jgi:8-oxo-dGTP pyrophosphatase MutT (NUDIX family)
MAGVWVFPGGRVEREDTWWNETEADPAASCAAPSEHAHRAAAIRELFEEAGLLVADDASGRPARLDEPGDGPQRPVLQRSLIARERMFRDVCLERGWRPAFERLVPLSRWITPACEPRRFDARFYILASPEGQDAQPDGHEAVATEWLPARQAADRYASGTIALAPPTLHTLLGLTRHESVDEALAAATAGPFLTIAPRVYIDGGVSYLLLPGDELYPVEPGLELPSPTRFAMKGNWRLAPTTG